MTTNNTNDISAEIKVSGQKLERVTSFNYLRSIISEEGSKPELLCRIAQTTAAITRLRPIWKDTNIDFGSKISLMCLIVISIFLYACETWTLTLDL